MKYKKKFCYKKMLIDIISQIKTLMSIKAKQKAI